jgi:hypothetical protein
MRRDRSGLKDSTGILYSKVDKREGDRAITGAAWDVL